jgi:hypothetical protein
MWKNVRLSAIAVLLALTCSSRKAFERFSVRLQMVNDTLFRGVTTAEFDTLRTLECCLVAMVSARS